MKPLSRASFLATALVAPFIFGGCGAAQAPLNASGATSSYLTHRVGPFNDPSTKVDIQNAWTGTIAGTGSATCWTISPGLPIVGAGDIAGPITLTYTVSTGCPIPSALGISYGPAAVTGQRCTFYTTYNAGGFSFSVTQSSNTACTIEYPPTVSAIFTYDQNSPNAHRSRRSVRIH